MVTLAVTGMARALLLAALLTGAHALFATWRQCEKGNPGMTVAPDHGRDDRVTALVLNNCNLSELHLDSFNKTDYPNLTTVALGVNSLQHVDAGVFKPLSYMTGELGLSYNRMRVVPVFGEYFLFRNLKRMFLSFNNITDIMDPRTFASCGHLELLDLHRNEIEYIHSDVFKQLNNLRHLSLDNNKLKFVSETLFQIKSLRGLHLESNLIEYIAPHAFRGTNLQMLSIFNNRLAYLPMNFASELTRLTSSGIYRDSFTDAFVFHFNPWDCGYLLELLWELKRLDVHYRPGHYMTSGYYKACRFQGRQAFHRNDCAVLSDRSVLRDRPWVFARNG